MTLVSIFGPYQFAYYVLALVYACPLQTQLIAICDTEFWEFSTFMKKGKWGKN